MVTTKLTGKLAATVALLLILGLNPLLQAEARPTGISGVPLGCVCHSGSESPSVNVTIEGVPEAYESNTTHILTITIEGGPAVTENSTNHGGFNLVANGGTLAPVDNMTHILDGEATHTEEGNDQRSWQVEWTTPNTNTEDITFTAIGNSVNGDGGAGSDDLWSKAEVTSSGTPEEEDSGLGYPFLEMTLLMALVLLASAMWVGKPEVEN